MRISEKKPDNCRLELILRTTLEVAAELGLKGTTISQISKRAKISPGIIYYYFNSKDEILHRLYTNLEQEFVEAVTNGDPLSMPIIDCYQHLWLKTYQFGLTHPQVLVFVENYQNFHLL